MYNVLGFLLCLAMCLALIVGFVHVGFALIEDKPPRSIWDWYVVAVCVAFCFAIYPTASQLGRWQAEIDIAKIEANIR